MTSMHKVLIVLLGLWGLLTSLGWMASASNSQIAAIDQRTDELLARITEQANEIRALAAPLVPAALPLPLPRFSADATGVVMCGSFNDKTQTWDRLRNPADFVPPASSQGKP